MLKWGKAGAAVIVLALVAADAAAAAEVVGSARIDAPKLPDACGTGGSESTPQLAARPGDPDELVTVYLVDGGNAAAAARSLDGGRTWRSAAIPGTTSCDGGEAARAFTVNPRVALGADGTAYHGSSFAGNDGPVFSFGVQAYQQPGAHSDWRPGAQPEGYAQDLAVVPTGAGEALLMWDSFDQVPNPLTYVPLGVSLNLGVSTDGRGLSDVRTLYDPGSSKVLDDPKIIRLDSGDLLALVSQTDTANIATFLAGAAVQFEALAFRSGDDGATWSNPAAAGDPPIFTHSDPGSEAQLLVGISDAAPGAGESAVLAWAEPAAGLATDLVMTRTDDGGLTWSEATTLVSSPNALFGPQIAIGPHGTIAAFFYDARNDDPTDERFEVDAWAAIAAPGSPRPRLVHLAGPIDMEAMLHPPDYGVDGDALGVTQDIVALRPGRFGITFTKPASGEGRGYTNVVYVKIRAGRRGRK